METLPTPESRKSEPKLSVFDYMTGHKVSELFIFGIIFSLLSTVIGISLTKSGYEQFADINFMVYLHFLLAVGQRLVLVAGMVYAIAYVLLRMQGIRDFDTIRDTTEPWVAISMVGALVAGIAITFLVLQ